MFFTRHTVTLTTDSGAATGYTPVVNGRIVSIRYVKGDFADGVDFAITTELAGQTVWAQLNVNASVTVAPRQPTHDEAGVASLYAGSGQAVRDYIVAAEERIQIVIAQGGNGKTGTFHIIVG